MGGEERRTNLPFLGPDGPILPEEYVHPSAEIPIQDSANEQARLLHLKPGKILLGADGPIGVVQEDGTVLLVQDFSGQRPEELSLGE